MHIVHLLLAVLPVLCFGFLLLAFTIFQHPFEIDSKNKIELENRSPI